MLVVAVVVEAEEPALVLESLIAHPERHAGDGVVGLASRQRLVAVMTPEGSSVIAIGASASLGESEPDGRMVVTVRPWWSIKMAEGAGPSIISQMLPPITMTVDGHDGPWTPGTSEKAKANVERDVLAHETWDQVVPDEDERERLWQGIAWTESAKGERPAALHCGETPWFVRLKGAGASRGQRLGRGASSLRRSPSTSLRPFPARRQQSPTRTGPLAHRAYVAALTRGGTGPRHPW